MWLLVSKYMALSFSGSRKRRAEGKIMACRADEAIWQLENERRQVEKAIGYKSKIALSGSKNGEIEDKGACSPDFAMTNEKIYLWTN